MNKQADRRADFERKVAEMADAAGEKWFDDKYDLTPAQLFGYVESLKQQLKAKEAENQTLRELCGRAAYMLSNTAILSFAESRNEGFEQRVKDLAAELRAAAKGDSE